MSGLAITLILCVLIGFTCFCGILSVENDRWKTKEKLAEEKRIGLGYIERERKTQEFMQEKIKIVSRYT